MVPTRAPQTRAGLPPLTTMGWLRFDAIRRLLRTLAPSSVLEVGAGQGAMATWLARRYEYVGVEPDERSRRVAVSRLAARGRGEMVATLEELGDRRFDVVCAFEVLEHIEDDAGALTTWARFLRPGGGLVLSVPAHPGRFGASDRLVGHMRRYDTTGLCSTLQGAGFETFAIEGYGALLGHLLKRVQDVLAARQAGPAEATSGTARSGRYLQPSSSPAALARATAAMPFRAVQVPLRRAGLGVGYVAAARSSRRPVGPGSEMNRLPDLVGRRGRQPGARQRGVARASARDPVRDPGAWVVSGRHVQQELGDQPE